MDKLFINQRHSDKGNKVQFPIWTRRLINEKYLYDITGNINWKRKYSLDIGLFYTTYKRAVI